MWLSGHWTDTLVKRGEAQKKGGAKGKVSAPQGAPALFDLKQDPTESAPLCKKPEKGTTSMRPLRDSDIPFNDIDLDWLEQLMDGQTYGQTLSNSNNTGGSGCSGGRSAARVASIKDWWVRHGCDVSFKLAVAVRDSEKCDLGDEDHASLKAAGMPVGRREVRGVRGLRRVSGVRRGVSDERSVCM